MQRKNEPERSAHREKGGPRSTKRGRRRINQAPNNRNRRLSDRRRGQAHTLEAVIGSLLLIAALLFAMQATAVTPLSASTSNQHIENQQRAVSHGLLATAADDGTLKETLLYWNGTPRDGIAENDAEGFVGSAAEETYYRNGTAPTTFLETLNRTLGEQQVAYNVNIRYHIANSSTGEIVGWRTRRLVKMGQPSDNAVTASRMITLYGDDRLTGPSTTRLDDGAAFYAPPLGDAVVGDSLVYNRLEVRIITWRM